MKSMTRLIAVVCLCFVSFSFASPDEKKSAAPAPASAAATKSTAPAPAPPELTAVENKEVDLLIEQRTHLETRLAELAKDPAVARFIEVQRSLQEANERELRFINGAISARHLNPAAIIFDVQKRTITSKVEPKQAVPGATAANPAPSQGPPVQK